MGDFYFSKRFVVLIASIFTAISVFGQMTIEITSGDIQVDPGETAGVEAVVYDSLNVPMDVKIKWYSDPGYLGKVDKESVFKASHPGEGYLFAKYAELKDSIAVIVNGTIKDGEDESEYPKVKVIPGNVKITTGDSVELVAFYINESDVKVDTFFNWSVWPEDLGEFPDSSKSMFYASEVGTGYIIASLGDFADTVKLKVEEPKEKHDNNSRKIVITPGDTIVNSGDLQTLQYEAEYKINGKKHENAEILWSISGDPVGSIDSTGLLTFSGETGLALVKAEYSNFSASVELLVIDSTADPVVNNITIHRVLPDGIVLPPKTFKEGESYKIGGLPFPLNILNGGQLHFPFGCISEDIVIYMLIPEEYAEIDADSSEVNFEEGIINGVRFNVMPEGSDTIVDPYYFNTPVNLSIVFKKGLLNSLGVSPVELDVFFADNTGFITNGADNVAIDTVKNKIYASIEHFSTIVVKQSHLKTIVKDIDTNNTDVLKIYPNPIHQSAQIMYKVNAPSMVNISIYNIVGKMVKVMVNKEVNEGSHIIYWDRTTEDGTYAPYGIYICRMLLDGNKSVVKKLILSK